MRVEHFLFAALRAWQQLQHNHFPEIEAAAEAFLERHGWEGRKTLDERDLRRVLEEADAPMLLPVPSSTRRSSS